MSDQGYGGPGQDGPDRNRQPNHGEQPSGDPQYPYGQPQYGEPQYGEPQYGEPQYGPAGYGEQQGPYGQPPYGAPQYGQPPYGAPQYGQPQYGYGEQPHPQQGHGQPGGGDGGNSQKGILIGLGAVVVAGLVVLVLAVTGVFSGDDTTTAQGGAPTPTSSPTDFPTDSQSSAPTSDPVAGPTLSETGTLPTSSSDLGSFCPSTAAATTTARLFVSFLILSQEDSAQGCVYQGRVTAAQIAEANANGPFSPLITSGQTGPVFTFDSVDGSHTLKVTVAKQSDGKFYVTAVSST